jgi:hypothetical protein
VQAHHACCARNVDGIDVSPAVLQVLHCNVPPGHKSELVVDPGPGVLLVVHGTGKAMVRASCVSDELVLGETDLQPGETGGSGAKGSAAAA